MKTTTIPGRNIKKNLFAGLTAATVVLPKAMAYATVAGLPVQVGLYTAFIPMIVYGLLGTSRVLSVSSTTTLAILTASQLALVVPDGDPGRLLTATACLTMLVGIILITAAVLRLGAVASFISSPVLTGFKAAIGLVIVLDQLPKLLGIHIDKEGFFRDIVSIFQHVPETSMLTLLVAIATLAVLIGVERMFKHSPVPLFAVCGGIGASWIFGLSDHGVSIVGHIPRGFPALTLPDLNMLTQLLPGAFGIALMSFTESIAAARACAKSDDPRILPNRELMATGLANFGGTFLGSMPAGGGTSQSVVVRSVGGDSQVASFVTAGASLATMLMLAPILGLLPHATLAAIVIVYSIGLIEPLEFLAIRKVRVMEFRWAIIACLGVLFFGTLQGIVVAIIISLITLARQSTHPQVYVLGQQAGTDHLRPVSVFPDDELFEGMLILRIEGRIYFLNAQPIAEQIQKHIAQHTPSVVVLDLSRVPDIEYSALQMLMEGDTRIRQRGLRLWLSGLNPAVMTAVKNSGFSDILGEERVLGTAREAVIRYSNELKPEQDGTIL